MNCPSLFSKTDLRYSTTFSCLLLQYTIFTRSVRDNYPQYVISMDEIFGKDVNGIERINLVDFLLNTAI